MLKFKKILMLPLIGSALLFSVVKSSNACVVDSSSYYYNKTGNDFKTIHNRLVDESINGYNYYKLNNFYYEYESNKVSFQDEEDFSGFLNNKFVGDYIIISEYSVTLEDILSNIGVCFSAKKSELMSYSTFSIPVKTMSSASYFDFNYASIENFLICDVTDFKDIIFDSSLSKDVVKSLFGKSIIIEYIDEKYTCYDNELEAKNDNDEVTTDISFVSKNTKIVKNQSGTFVVNNNIYKPYTFEQIKASLGAYDGKGNNVDIEFVKTGYDDIYDEKDIYIGYSCLKFSASSGNVSKEIIVKIYTENPEYEQYYNDDDITSVEYSYMTIERLRNLIRLINKNNVTEFIGYMYKSDDSITFINSENDLIKVEYEPCCVLYYLGDTIKTFTFDKSTSDSDFGEYDFINFNANKIVAENVKTFTYNELLSFLSKKINANVTGIYRYADKNNKVYELKMNSTLNIEKLDEICLAYYCDNDKGSNFSTCVLKYEYNDQKVEDEKKEAWYDWLLNLLNKIVEFFKKLFSGGSGGTTGTTTTTTTSKKGV